MSAHSTAAEKTEKKHSSAKEKEHTEAVETAKDTTKAETKAASKTEGTNDTKPASKSDTQLPQVPSVKIEELDLASTVRLFNEGEAAMRSVEETQNAIIERFEEQKANALRDVRKTQEDFRTFLYNVVNHQNRLLERMRATLRQHGVNVEEPTGKSHKIDGRTPYKPLKTIRTKLQAYLGALAMKYLKGQSRYFDESMLEDVMKKAAEYSYDTLEKARKHSDPSRLATFSEDARKKIEQEASAPTEIVNWLKTTGEHAFRAKVILVAKSKNLTIPKDFPMDRPTAQITEESDTEEETMAASA